VDQKLLAFENKELGKIDGPKVTKVSVQFRMLRNCGICWNTSSAKWLLGRWRMAMRGVINMDLVGHVLLVRKLDGCHSE